jgi:molybdate/tungstate transport system substrate-binding protein
MKRHFINIIAVIFLFVPVIFFYSCSHSSKKETLIVFHAGSLAVPFKAVADSFMKENPNVVIQAESSGSLDAARKISDLKKPCDFLAVSDYKVIDKLLIPLYAKENILFATNEMVIAYTTESRKSDSINSTNWFRILLEEDIAVGRSDPDADPCGYRSIFVYQLAGIHYQIPGLSEQLTNKKNTLIRPKEVDLLALLETGNVDYILIYKSVAIQHNLKYLVLPNEINLGSPELESFYNKSYAIVSGSMPDMKTSINGTPVKYSYCIPLNAPNPDLAVLFANFLTDTAKGGRILKKNGMIPVKK